MKHFRLILASIALASASISGAASAAPQAGSGLAIQGDVHGASAYNFRGHAFSAGDPSIGLTASVRHASGLYGAYGVDTIKLGNVRTGEFGTGGTQLHNTLTVGYAQPVGDVVLGGGLTRHFFSGPQSVSDLSFTEAFVSGAWYGLEGKLSVVAESSRVDIPGFSRGDVYGELGYTHRIGAFSVGGDVGYSVYDASNTHNGLAMAQLRAAYSVTPQLDVSISHQLGWGDDARGNAATGNNKTFVKASYRF